MKKFCLICAAALLVVVLGVFWYGVRRPVEEVPEIALDVTVAEPVSSLLPDMPVPLLPPPSTEDADPLSEWVHTMDGVDTNNLVFLYVPQHDIGVIPGSEVSPEPPPVPEPRGPEEIEPFDHEEHHEALLALAPVHHARMAEARIAMEELKEYEAELSQRSEYREQVQVVEELRAAREAAGITIEGVELEDALIEEIQVLHELWKSDPRWVELKAEADGANQRRENVRQKIVERIQNRMRHDFAVRRAERDQALLEQGYTAEENL